MIRGRSTANPVLLMLAGGPGGSELASFRKHNATLEESFTVVHWEQRGAENPSRRCCATAST